MREIFDPFRHRKTLIQIAVCALVFIGMAIPFKVMVLVEGFTEVRPVNAVPVIVGLLFGAAGGWGSAVGNLIADLFGTLSPSSVLGFFGNFLAAYLPYKLWHIFKKGEAPNARSFKNIGIYILISAISSLAVAIFIANGMDVFFDFWSPNIFYIICMNDFLFPVFLGLPVLIVLTCDDIRIKALIPVAGTRHPMLQKVSLVVFATMSVAIFVMVCFGFSMSGNLPMLMCGALFLISMAAVVIL